VSFNLFFGLLTGPHAMFHESVLLFYKAKRTKSWLLSNAFTHECHDHNDHEVH